MNRSFEKGLHPASGLNPRNGMMRMVAHPENLAWPVVLMSFPRWQLGIADMILNTGIVFACCAVILPAELAWFILLLVLCPVMYGYALLLAWRMVKFVTFLRKRSLAEQILVCPIPSSQFANAFLRLSLVALLFYSIPCVALWLIIGTNLPPHSEYGMILLLLQALPAITVWTISWGHIVQKRLHAYALVFLLFCLWAIGIEADLSAEVLQAMIYLSLQLLVLLGPAWLYVVCLRSYRERVLASFRS